MRARPRPDSSSIIVEAAEAAAPLAAKQSESVLPIKPVGSDSDQETNAGSPAALELHTSAVPSERRVEADICEQLWRDGTLHWGAREGEGWTERWQTQEGDTRRFGTKNGRDVKKCREWQERWEQADGVTRIEKRVVQRESAEPDSSEVERWVERLDITAERILETQVGEDRRTGRQWRVYSEYALSAEKKRTLIRREVDSVWGSGPRAPRRTERIELQPAGRVLKTEITAVAEDSEVEETSFVDQITGNSWGSKTCKTAEATSTKEWHLDKVTGDERRSETTNKPFSTTGVVKSYTSASGEHYREDWGTESTADGSRAWSSKWRRRGEAGEPWGDYRETIDSRDEQARACQEVRQEKWWTEGSVEHRERWTERRVKSADDSRDVALLRYGHNTYGTDKTEEWREEYELDAAQCLQLRERRLEANTSSQRRVEIITADEEHHTVEDKSIGQVDEWHVDRHTGAKWGQKDGRNSEGVCWHERWREEQNERWIEKRWKAGETEWGELSGSKGPSERWSERWGRSAGSQWSERTEVDEAGNEITRRSGETVLDGRVAERYTDNYGRTVVGEQWAYKEGYHEHHGDWLEKWNETAERKTAEKRGSCPHTGDRWFEAWTQDYDAETGEVLHQTARKEGENARGERWVETWTETGQEKYARKEGSNAEAAWLEEWRDEADGAKWCRKWGSRADETWEREWGHTAGERHKYGRESANGQEYNSWSHD